MSLDPLPCLFLPTSHTVLAIPSKGYSPLSDSRITEGGPVSSPKHLPASLGYHGSIVNAESGNEKKYEI